MKTAHMSPGQRSFGRIAIVAASALALVAGAGIALAQSGPLAAAIASGQVGEQADGFLGAAKPVSADVKAQLEAINIKRRAAYTDQASKHGVALSEWAATIGCPCGGRGVIDGPRTSNCAPSKSM